MVEKIGTIKNPLTIIAIFAGIAEISGTIVLPFISEVNQGNYIWFLMIFPLSLVLLFFVTLNFNHKVLYAPSDFQNEENFFKSIRSASPSERNDKLLDEVREIAQMPTTQVVRVPSIETSKIPSPTITQRDLRANYLLAEELILNRIASDMGGQLVRNVTIGGAKSSNSYVFDGMIRKGDGGRTITFVEVKYFQNQAQIESRLIASFAKIRDALLRFTSEQFEYISVVFAVATDKDFDKSKVGRALDAEIAELPFELAVKYFSLDELERELEARK